MRLKLFVCPVCGVTKLQNISVNEYRDPMCTGDGVNGHNSGMSFVHEVDLPAFTETPKTYEVIGSLRPHECRFGCDSDYAVNCNCGGDCPKHKAFAAVSDPSKREKKQSGDGNG